MKVAIVTSGYLPIPAALGGAVEALVQNLLVKNEEFGAVQFMVFTTWHPEAEKAASRFRKSGFVFIKAPVWIRILDRVIYFIVRKFLRMENDKSYRYIIQRLHYLNRVAGDLHRNDYDKIVLENNATLFIALKRYQNFRKYTGRYYFHLHNEVTNDFGCGEIMRQSHKVLGVSRYIDRTLEHFPGGFSAKQLDLLRNCVDTTEFASPESKLKARQLRNHYGIGSDEKVIIFSGRLSKEKGIRELLIAFTRADLPKVKLVIAGGYFYASGMISDYETELRMISEPIKDRIVFTGFINYSDMPAVYGMADVAAIPSMWDDPAPLTVIESMASGLPLITTVSGGIPEYVDANGAVLLKRDDRLTDRLADSMKQILSDDVLRQRMAAANIQASTRMNLDQYYKDFVEKISDRQWGTFYEGSNRHRGNAPGASREGRSR